MEELAYSVRPRVLARYTGQLALVLGALSLPPVAVGLASGDDRFSLRCGIAAAVLLGAGGWLARVRATGRIQSNEALAVTAFAFLLAPLAMTWPLMATGMSALDAFFEAVSGVTTTGLTTVVEVQNRPPAFLFTRAWMQWYGGLGFVVLSLALLLRPGFAALQLAGQTGLETDDLVGNTRVLARAILGAYCGLTAFWVAVLLLCGMRLHDSLLHTFAAVSTGGFSSRPDSLLGDAWPVQWAVVLACLSCSIPLVRYHRLRSNAGLVLADLQLRGLLAIAVPIGIGTVWVLHHIDGLPWTTALHHGPLLTFFAQTTSGFSTLDPGSLSSAARFLLIVAMFVGGGVGSTAGGIKVLRLLLLLGVLRSTMMRTALPPHAVRPLKLAGRRVEDDEIHDAAAVFFLFVLVIAASWLAFLLLGQDPLDSLFEIVSACSTVGLSTGLTAGDLDPRLKAVLCLDMLLGRLELFALLVLVWPRTWIGRRSELV